MFARSLTAATLVLAFAACSGPIFGSRVEGQGPIAHRERTPPIEELLALRIDSVELTAEGAEQLRLLGSATRQARDEDRVRLRRHRGELVADLLVAARAWSDISPERSEWYAAAAGLLVGVDSADPELADAALERVRIDLGDAARRDGDDVLADVSAALGLRDVPQGRDPRTTLLQLAELSEMLSPWARYGDSCDGGTFSRQANVFRPVAVAGESLGDPSLASDENLHSAQALLAVAGLCADARTLDSPLMRSAEGVIVDVESRVRGAAVPLETPSNFIVEDIRLSPPASFGPPPEEAGRGLGFTFRRTVLVRTDGIYAMVVPHVAIRDDGEPWCPAVAAGWGFPGRVLLSFDRLGAVPPEAVEGDALPAVSESLAEMEQFLSNVTWLPLEETRVDERQVGVSLIADGDTYFSTLRPLLESLRNLHYSPIALHTLHEESGSLDAVAVRLVPTAGEADNLLIVREDGYVIQPYDPENLVAPIAVSRVTRESLLELHRRLVDGFADGTLDQEQPLTVRVDDNSVDYAILAHLLGSIGFARDLAEVATDRELLEAAVEVDEAGIPVVLAPAGLRLAL